MAKAGENNTIEEIQAILCSGHTAAELAQEYLDERPPSGVASDDRQEIAQELAGFEALRDRPELRDRIAEAYFHFSAHILYEDGFFSSSRILDMLLSPDQIAGRLNDGINAYEMVSNAPLVVSAKTVQFARDNLLRVTGEPLYLESSQLTDLQMLCLSVPEAIDDVLRVLGERPCIRSEQGEERPYLRAFIRVISALMAKALPTEQETGGDARAERVKLIAGILRTFYGEYLSFPSEEYLTDLVNRSV